MKENGEEGGEERKRNEIIKEVEREKRGRKARIRKWKKIKEEDWIRRERRGRRTRRIKEKR